MPRSPIQPARIQRLNSRDEAVSGHYVLYWIQQSQRADHNHALEYAVEQANRLGRPLLVGFGLMDGYPEANLRHYQFMLEGLQETQGRLARRGIPLVVQRGSPDGVALQLARDAALVICDRGYLRHQKEWRQRVADEAPCGVIQVEADVVVPVELASSKAEVGARTLRPRLERHLDDFLVPLPAVRLRQTRLAPSVKSIDLQDLDRLLGSMDLDRSVAPVPLFRGGTSQAMKLLRAFVSRRLPGYTGNRSHPASDHVSHMSKYLHFGQVSPVVVARAARENALAAPADQAAFLDELIVRRELAQNHVHYNPDYDRFEGLPSWARSTLQTHRGDRRSPLYTRSELEAGDTHDPYWNAALREMKFTGYMHNYMRMYWGKKILEWSASPEEAFATALYLNNKYFLDGRDANSFANVAWVFGQHDRPWPERPIYGTVRSMTASGLERKTDPEAYVEKVDRLIQSLV